jgi:hypothetical protein
MLNYQMFAFEYYPSRTQLDTPHCVAVPAEQPSLVAPVDGRLIYTLYHLLLTLNDGNGSFVVEQ